MLAPLAEMLAFRRGEVAFLFFCQIGNVVTFFLRGTESSANEEDSAFLHQASLPTSSHLPYWFVNRDEYQKYDLENKIRENFVSALQKEFGDFGLT